MSARALVVLLWVAILSPAAARASWIPGGFPVCTDPGGQDVPRAASDGAGGAFIAWRDYRSGTGGFDDLDVYVQHVTLSGEVAPGWTLNGVGACTAPAYQDATDLVSDGQGGVILVWEDYRTRPITGSDIYAMRLTASGELAPGWPVNGVAVCVAPQDQWFPKLIADGSGGAIIAWQDYRYGDSSTFTNPQVFAQHLTASGGVAPGWPADGLQVTTQPSGGPEVVSDGLGGALIVWLTGDVYAQRITGAGTIAAGWPAAGLAVCTAREGQGNQTVCTDGAGGAFVAWEDYRTYFGFGSRFSFADVYAHHVMADGTLAPGWPVDGLGIATGPGLQASPFIVPDGVGGAVLAWVDLGSGTEGVHAERITPSGNPAGGWSAGGRPVSTAAGSQFVPQVAPDGESGAFIAFVLEASHDNVQIQHLTATGDIAAGWSDAGTPVASPQSSQYQPTIAASGIGAIVAWNDGRNLVSDIYAQRFESGGVVPVEVSLVSAEATPGRATLTWFSEQGPGFAATAERRTPTTDWQPLGEMRADGTGRIVLEDRAVEAGGRYAYRLAYSSGSSVSHSADVWVDVPSAYSLALEGLRPNPARGPLTASFSLPGSAPASLELIDLTGRVALRREVGGLGAGRHLLELGASAQTPPGKYWLRLRQAGGTRVASALILP